MSTQPLIEDVSHLDEAGSPPVVREIARRLLENGTSPALARRVLARVESRRLRADFTHPIDLAAQEIGSAFPRVVLSTRRQEGQALAILGAPGVGRSAVARKLALRMRAQDRSVAVLAVEQPGSTKPEWLVTWFEEIGVSARIMTPGVALPPRTLRGARVVLVDGSGHFERDARAIDELSRGSASHLTWQRVGVLAADVEAERLRDEARALRQVGADCIVITRLDLASAPATVLEIAAEAGLGIAFVCDGTRDERHLHRLGPELAADLFLTGKVA